MDRNLKILTFSLGFLLISSLPLLGQNLNSSKVINKIVAVVGEEFLTLYELDQMAEPFYNKIILPETPKETAEEIKNKIRKELLEQWIEDTLIGLEAKKYGIQVSDEEIENFLKVELKKEENLKDSSEELKEKIRDRLVKIKFIQIMVRDKIAIPETEIKRVYEEKIKNFNPIPKYELEILVIKEDLLVKELYEEGLRGKSFQEIHQKNKEHTFYFQEVFLENEIDEKIREILQNLKPHEITEPLKRGNSYQIIRLIKKSSGSPPQYEEIKKELYEEIFQKNAQDYLEKWIKELKDKKFIKVYL